MNRETEPDASVLERAAGVTGVGWTASALGYLGAAIGVGDTPISNPQSLLYLGVVCFLATVGIDRLNDRRSDGKTDDGDRTDDGGRVGDRETADGEYEVEGGGERDLGDGHLAD